ncbi:MAG: DUF3727 domain-containing protein [Scytolyngbya sp. HA4215-MV1]|nr:DUF3727 domain-containing protein [Scytolyngbya sp. HA4215-MV1]
MEEDVPTVTLTDEAGRTLTCTVEHTLEVEEQEYVLLLPIDSPIEIFAWEDEEDEDPILVDDDDEIDEIFPTAKVVLEEQNLVLKRTAVTLTVEGELPDFVDDEEFEDEEELEDEEYEEELQLLARFYHEEQEYAIYTPLDPFFIFARLDASGQPQLLSQEEFKKLEPMLPMLEDQLFDALD